MSEIITESEFQLFDVVPLSEKDFFQLLPHTDDADTALGLRIGQLVHKNKWTICECGFCHKLFLGTEGEVFCHAAECIEAQKQQKEAIYTENTKAYSAAKRDYDAYVRRYKKVLVEAGIEKYHPAEFDEFMQAKQERMDDMDKLKKRLIRNGLPTKELEKLSAKYKAEMKAIAEELVERFGKKG